MQQRLKNLNNGPGEAKSVHYRLFEVDSVTDELITLSASSEEPYERWFGTEILDHAPENVDLSFLASGNAPFLRQHDPWDLQLGRISSAWLEDKRIKAEVVPSVNPDNAGILADIKAAITRNISIGYIHTEILFYDEDTDVYRFAFKPLEVSLVAVPADETVGIGRHATLPREISLLPSGDNGALPIQFENRQMTDPVTEPQAAGDPTPPNTETPPNEGNRQIAPPPAAAVTAATQNPVVQVDTDGIKRERERITNITALGKKFDVDATEFISGERSVDEFRAHILEQVGPKQIDTSPRMIGMSNDEVKDFSFARAIKAAANSDWNDAGLEKEMCGEAARLAGKSVGAAGFVIPPDIEPSVRASAANNPAMIPTDRLSFIEGIYARTALNRLGVELLPNLTGEIEFPQLLTGSTTYWITGDGDDIPESDITSGIVGMGPKTAGNLVPMTHKLLQNSAPSIEGVVRKDLFNGLAVALDKAAISADGSGNLPLGILNQSGINLVPIGANGGAPTWDGIVKMWEEIVMDDISDESLRVLTNPRVVSKLQRTKYDAGDTNSNYIMMTAKDDLNGYPVVKGTTVPSDLTKGTGTALSAMILGVWSEMMVGQWSSPTIMVNPYSKFASAGVDIRILVDMNFMVRYPQAFCKVSDIVTT